MPRKESEAVPEGNGHPILQQEEFGSGQPTLVDVYGKIGELLQRWWMAEEMRVKDQRVARLERRGDGRIDARLSSLYFTVLQILCYHAPITSL